MKKDFLEPLPADRELTLQVMRKADKMCPRMRTHFEDVLHIQHNSFDRS